MSLFDLVPRRQYHRIMGKGDDLAAIAADFDAYKAELVRLAVTALNDPDEQERWNTAEILAQAVLPALVDDREELSRRMSAATILRLARELRPPKDDAELADLNNAMFYYAKRRVMARTRHG